MPVTPATVSRHQENHMPSRTRPKASALQIALRNAVERRRAELGKRYQCDQLQFWRQCRRAACRKHRACIGDPYACFDRGLAAMSEADKEWLRGAIVATFKGAGTRAELVRRIGEEVAAARRAKPVDLQDMASWLRSALSAARQAAGLAVGPSPQAGEQADEETRGVASEHNSPLSPDISAAEPALPAADPSPPAARRWTGPLNPPQAYCDEQGRLIMPDPADVAEYNERLRKGLTLSEMVDRSRV
jgi:hypothetical protein